MDNELTLTELESVLASKPKPVVQIAKDKAVPVGSVRAWRASEKFSVSPESFDELTQLLNKYGWDTKEISP